MPEHSPLPWIAWNSHDGKALKSWRVGSRGKTDGVVTPVCILDNSVPGYEEHANAMFIEKACNLHYELLAACEKVVEHYQSMSGNPSYPIPDKHWIEGALMARSAINKAKGEQA
jgi:hypothetical protein